MADTTQTASTSRITDAIAQAENRFYFNGFVTGIGNGDIVISLERSGRPECVLNCSYTVAKTLAVKLGRLVSELEEAAGRSIMTTNEIDEALANLSKKRGEKERAEKSASAKPSGNRRGRRHE